MVLGRLVPFAAVASAGALNVFLMRGEEIRRGIDVFPAMSAKISDEGLPARRDNPLKGDEGRTEVVEKRTLEDTQDDLQGAVERAVKDDEEKSQEDKGDQSLGKSRKAATMAVGETAISRVLNATPIMVLPPLILVRLQRTKWLAQRPRMVLPVNLGKFQFLLDLLSTQCICTRDWGIDKRTQYVRSQLTSSGLILTTSIFALPLALAAFPQRQAVQAERLEDEFHGRGGREGLVEFNRGI